MNVVEPAIMCPSPRLASDLTPAAHNRMRRALLTWFARHQRDLPWRRTRDSYRIWVSEVMLQQTRIAVVVPAYERFVQRFPTIATLAQASEDEVLSSWSGLGYYSRARALQRAARQLADVGATQFPDDWDAARKLAGVGPYTAAAVLSIAYGQAHAALDGNIARVLARLWRTAEPGSAALAHELLDTRHPGDWNQALMELGQTLCTPRAVGCTECPLLRWCAAGQVGDAERWPSPKRRPEVERIDLDALVVRDASGRVLLGRGEFAALPHLWLPLLGDKAGRRQARDQHVGQVAHAIVHRRFRVAVYLRPVSAQRLDGLAQLATGERRAFSPAEIASVGRSSLLTKVLRLLPQPA